MERVTGIGGFFFRAKAPEALAKWYLDHLGVNPVPTGEGEQAWEQEAGSTAFAPFEQGTEYFGNAEKMWMINFRVRDLGAMIAQLRAAGITASEPESYPPMGSFARIHDPEGNPVELWQPEDAPPSASAAP